MMKPAFDQFPKLDIEPPHFSVYIDGYNLHRAINYSTPEHLLGLGWGGVIISGSVNFQLRSPSSVMQAGDK